MEKPYLDVDVAELWAHDWSEKNTNEGGGPGSNVEIFHLSVCLMGIMGMAIELANFGYFGLCFFFFFFLACSGEHIGIEYWG